MKRGATSSSPRLTDVKRARCSWRQNRWNRSLPGSRPAVRGGRDIGGGGGGVGGVVGGGFFSFGGVSSPDPAREVGCDCCGRPTAGGGGMSEIRRRTAASRIDVVSEWRARQRPQGTAEVIDEENTGGEAPRNSP